MNLALRNTAIFALFSLMINGQSLGSAFAQESKQEVKKGQKSQKEQSLKKAEQQLSTLMEDIIFNASSENPDIINYIDGINARTNQMITRGRNNEAVGAASFTGGLFALIFIKNKKGKLIVSGSSSVLGSFYGAQGKKQALIDISSDQALHDEIKNLVHELIEKFNISADPISILDYTDNLEGVLIDNILKEEEINQEEILNHFAENFNVSENEIKRYLLMRSFISEKISEMDLENILDYSRKEQINLIKAFLKVLQTDIKEENERNPLTTDQKSNLLRKIKKAQDLVLSIELLRLN